MAKLVCTIELDKEKGITVKVEDTQGQLTQTMTLDGEGITLEVKSSSDTSTIVQKADSVTVTCKDFKVTADTVTLESKQASKWTSQQTLELKSTQDMTFTSSAKLTQSATQDLALSSSTGKASMKASASKVELEGMQASLKATAGEAKVDGLQLALSGSAKAELKAPMVTVSAQGKLGLESTGMADLKGSITSVGGSLVKLG
ncbi:hypothetical protein [Archangium lansingense]|uniref:Uncharacterized protein n=1 Tax=Archangium lansingense TaxID=2995310 RepID=A0ABT4A2C0_9BACT|nr:hypothetical protein [Archangium lansinium]MCY1075144.1 hypothetical protein [Archangium lansinium]